MKPSPLPVNRYVRQNSLLREAPFASKEPRCHESVPQRAERSTRGFPVRSWLNVLARDGRTDSKESPSGTNGRTDGAAAAAAALFCGRAEISSHS